jgi:hypothetical protein
LLWVEAAIRDCDAGPEALARDQALREKLKTIVALTKPSRVRAASDAELRQLGRHLSGEGN